MSDYIQQMYGNNATPSMAGYPAAGGGVAAPTASASTGGLGPAIRANYGNIATGLNTTGAVAGGFTRASALRSNAASFATEGQVAEAQGFEQEAQQRRSAGMALGRETAAVAQAGTGFGGSEGRAIRQSAQNMELDALNIRYKSQLQRWAYASQATDLRYEAGLAQTGGFVRGAAALLKGYSGNYVGSGDY